MWQEQGKISPYAIRASQLRLLMTTLAPIGHVKAVAYIGKVLADKGDI